MSGRSLRRLPVLAHARHIGMLSAPAPRTPNDPVANGKIGRRGGADVAVWLDAMERVVDGQAVQRGHLDH